MRTLRTLIASACLASACTPSAPADDATGSRSACVTGMNVSGDQIYGSCLADYVFNGTDYGPMKLEIVGSSSRGPDKLEATATLMRDNTRIHITIDETSGEVRFSSMNGHFSIQPDHNPDQLWVLSQHQDVKAGNTEAPDSRQVSCPGLDEFVKTLQARPSASLKEAYFPCGELEKYADSLSVVRDNRKADNQYQLGMAWVTSDELTHMMPGRFAFVTTKINAAVNAAVQLGQNNYNSTFQNQGTSRGRWDVRNGH